MALEWLEAAMHLRDPGLELMKTDPLLDSLRNEPRFQAVMRQLRFPESLEVSTPKSLPSSVDFRFAEINVVDLCDRSWPAPGQGITRSPAIVTCIGPLTWRPLGSKNVALAVPLNVLPLTFTAKEISPRDANWCVFRSAVISTSLPLYPSPSVCQAPMRLLSLVLGSPASGLD